MCCFAQVLRVSCGWRHSACVSWSGHLFTWGDSTAGRLGLPSDAVAGRVTGVRVCVCVCVWGGGGVQVVTNRCTTTTDFGRG